MSPIASPLVNEINADGTLKFADYYAIGDKVGTSLDGGSSDVFASVGGGAIAYYTNVPFTLDPFKLYRCEFTATFINNGADGIVKAFGSLFSSPNSGNSRGTVVATNRTPQRTIWSSIDILSGESGQLTVKGKLGVPASLLSQLSGPVPAYPTLTILGQLGATVTNATYGSAQFEIQQIK